VEYGITEVATEAGLSATPQTLENGMAGAFVPIEIDGGISSLKCPITGMTVIDEENGFDGEAEHSPHLRFFADWIGNIYVAEQVICQLSRPNIRLDLSIGWRRREANQTWPPSTPGVWRFRRPRHCSFRSWTHRKGLPTAVCAMFALT